MTISFDAERVECPHCSKECCLTDYVTDGCLDPGVDFECEHCDGRVEIYDVVWEPTIWCRAKASEDTERCVE